MLLNKDETVFVLVDVQGNLAKAVHESEVTLNNLQRLIRSLQIIDIPIIWLEQYPAGLGPTSEEISAYLTGLAPIEKVTFSAYKNDEFKKTLEATGRRQVLIAGIETHICVYQTAVELKMHGYDVHVVEDAVSSRTLENKQIGLAAMKARGVLGTSVEMAVYELLKKAGIEQFKKILQLIK